MIKSGRIKEMTGDLSGGVVQDSDGTEYPFLAEGEINRIDEVVVFDIQDDSDGDDSQPNFATIIS